MSRNSLKLDFVFSFQPALMNVNSFQCDRFSTWNIPALNLKKINLSSIHRMSQIGEQHTGLKILYEPFNNTCFCLNVTFV